MKWFLLISDTQLRYSKQLVRLALIFCGCFAMLSLTGCTITRVTKKPDLQSFRGDVNTYNRLAFIHERKYHLLPHNRVINDYRWMHGATPLIPSSHVAGTGQMMSQLQESGQPTEIFSQYSDGTDSSVLMPAPASDIDTLSPPQIAIETPLPSPETDNGFTRPPVEIIIPPVDSIFNDENGSSKTNPMPLAPPSIEGPTARLRNTWRNEPPVQPVGYQRSKAALPGSSILFARP